MLGIVFLIALLALSLTAYLVRGQREFLRESILIGFVLWGSGIVASTEALSVCHAIGFWGVFIFWVIVVCICGFFLSQQWGKFSARALFDFSSSPKVLGSDEKWLFLEKVFFNRIVFFAFCLGIIALVAPPNTYDAMTYHMSRVMHWIANHSVQYYPTHIPRELYYPVFPEYVILHFQVLSAGDHWANFVQWLSMAGTLIAISLIAQELGARSRGQIITSLIVVTIPMGVLQATSTQTDYVVSLWLCIFIYSFLRWRRSFNWGYALLAGTSLGLAVATKGVALIFAGPFVGWMIIEAICRMERKKAWMLLVIACLAGIFYLGSFYRNTVFFHGNAGKVVSADADSLVNARFCLEGFVANALRNTALHLVTPSITVNTAIKEGVYQLASNLHINLNNKDWTYIGIPFDTIDFRGNENYLGNPLHVLLFAIVLSLFFIFPGFRNRETVFYLIASLIGAVLFNAILKWQPWHARFHLPMFIIFAPIAGFVIERFKFRWIASAALGTIFLFGWVVVLINVSKQICSTVSVFYPQNRDFMHYMMADAPRDTYLKYQGLAQILGKMGYQNIGLIMGTDENEYLLWVALNPSAAPSRRIESVLVDNASGALAYPLGTFIPDAIIAINDDRAVVSWENNIYQAVWHDMAGLKKISLLVKVPGDQMAGLR